MQKNYLYISDAGTNDVVVYRYPSGTEAGVLTGFDEPQGECVDRPATSGSQTPQRRIFSSTRTAARPRSRN